MVTAEITTSQGYLGIRPYLFSVAYRMTGSASDAEDLVQDAWIRYLDAGSPTVSSLRAYLTTIISRLALDFLKSARVQREQYIGHWLPEPVLTASALPGPDETIEQREAISLAFLTLLERLNPEQRVVYVLREAFEFSYDEIAAHLEKTAAACRQIFHRACSRIAADRQPAVAPTAEHQRLLEQFGQALSAGNAVEMAKLLTDDVIWIGDGGGVRLAMRRMVVGRDRVSRGLAGWESKFKPEMRISHQLADLNGAPAMITRDHGRIERVIVIDIEHGAIRAVRAILNPHKLLHLEQSLAAAR